MLAICFEAERFSVDALYERLLTWFGTKPLVLACLTSSSWPFLPYKLPGACS